jgi:regulatory protein
MEIPQALNKLREICSRQEKCPADVITLLKKWDIGQELHHEILEQLKSERFIDEYRYASAFIRDKMKFDRWGIIKIRFLLKVKGISRDVVENALGEIDKDEYLSIIGRELGKKRKTLKGAPREIWAKLARYGSSRGYEMEYMREFLKESTGEDE